MRYADVGFALRLLLGLVLALIASAGSALAHPHVWVTMNGIGGVALRGLELGASLLVIAFGLMLLTGYIATERLFGA